MKHATRQVLCLALTLVGLVLLGAVGRFAALGAMPMNPVTLGWMLFLDSSPLSKVAFLMSTGVLGLAMSAAVSRRGREMLTVLGWVCPLVGVLAASRDGYTIYEVAGRLHVADPRVTAPSIAGATLVAAVGLLAGAAALASAARSET